MDDVVPGTSAGHAKSSAERRPQWRDLRDWLSLVHKRQDLKTISAPVDPNEELAAITFMATQVDENAPALLFDNLVGDQRGCRVLANMLGASKDRFALAMGLDPALSIREMVLGARTIMVRRMPPVMIEKSTAPVNEVVVRGDDVDMTAFPSLRFWPGDGGPYIGTGDITLTRPPDSQRINVGCYRQMVHGPKRIGMYCSPGKHARLDREAWWRAGKPCEVVAAYGIDPVLFMLGSMSFSSELSELDVAGGVMGTSIELTEAEYVSLPIPAHAELVIEGLLYPDDSELEGPLGEFTGYYGNERAVQPVIQVKAIHHRRNPIITAAVMARHPSSEIGTGFSIMRSARVLDDLERIGIPGIQAVYMTPAAIGGYGMMVISMKQRYAGHVAQALAVAAQCPAAAFFTKWIIAVDDDVDPTDLNQVLWALSTRCNPIDDFEFMRRTWSSPLDTAQYPPELRPYGSKVLIDACKPHRHIQHFPQQTLLRKKTYDRVKNRWAELGFSGTPREPLAFHPD